MKLLFWQRWKLWLCTLSAQRHLASSCSRSLLPLQSEPEDVSPGYEIPSLPVELIIYILKLTLTYRRQDVDLSVLRRRDGQIRRSEEGAGARLKGDWTDSLS